MPIIRDLLDDETKGKIAAVHPSNKSKRNNKQKSERNNKQKKTKKQIHHEQLTREDYEFLMGMYRDTYKRVNGKVKRK